MWIKRIAKFFAVMLILLVLLVVGTVAILYNKQEVLVQKAITAANENLPGKVVVEGSRISIFQTFPYIALDFRGIKIFEGKDTTQTPIVNLADLYVGFDIWSVIEGNIEIKAIKLKDGKLVLVQDSTGVLNIAQALGLGESEAKDAEEELKKEFNINLKKIKLQNITISKINQADSLEIFAHFNQLATNFKARGSTVKSNLETNFLLSILQNGDSTLIRNKNITLKTGFDIENDYEFISIAPSYLKLEKAVFSMGGTVDLKNELTLNLNFAGQKPNFDLFLAFAPEDITENFASFKNKGEVFFEASVKGKAAPGNTPKVEATFGCRDAYFVNTLTNARVEELSFKGFFTNGDSAKASTSRFAITEFTARPAEGRFKGNLVVQDFTSPDIETKLDVDLDLAFLAAFFNLEQLESLRGKVELELNFRDIIDLENPAKAIDKFNESYFTRLRVTNLNFKIPDYPYDIRDINIRASMDGNEAKITRFGFFVGKSDIELTGSVSNLPAIIHHTDIPVKTDLRLKSKLIDLEELTTTGKEGENVVNERITDLEIDLAFLSSAKALTESPNLPVGNFYINKFGATLEKYPHRLNDFLAHFSINDSIVEIKNFKGNIDTSDLTLSGFLANYPIFLRDKKQGTADLNFNISSNFLKLKDILSYDTLNYLPEEYREEELSNFNFAARSKLHFKDSLQAYNLNITSLRGRLKVHPIQLEKFRGQFIYEPGKIEVKDFKGILGSSSLALDMLYFLSAEPNASNKSYVNLRAPKLNFDELFSYKPEPVEKEKDYTKEHEEAYNIFEVPFPNLAFNVNINQLKYKNYDIRGFVARGSIKPDHKIFLDTLGLKIAGGDFTMKGYFDGSNPEDIYMYPDIQLIKVRTDQLAIKFQEGSEDKFLSETITGTVTGQVKGKLKIYPDFVPKLDKSDLEISATITDGLIQNYEPLLAMSNFFGDRNLARVRFDTIQNTLTFKNGELRIPNMTIASTLGFMELSGRQDLQMNMEYFFRIPWRLVTSVGSNKLFGRRNTEVDPDQEDGIITRDPNRRTRFINLRMRGTPDNFDISLGRDRNSS
ncbi:MAG: hypothetical protein ACXITV_05320 [Luteibaculaceae bacterium]